MSFLAGRLAAQEGAYFLQESRNAAGRLAQKLPAPEHGPRPASPPPSADVLPEILRHSMPLRPTLPPPNSTLYGSTRLALPPGGAEAAGVAPDVLSPLRSYVALPQATFGLGPKRCASGAFGIDLIFSLKVSCGFIYRWELPTDRPHYSSSSTNEGRHDMHPPPMDPEKLKAVIARYSQFGKALLRIAGTILVIGEATAELLYTANKLQLHSVDDVRAKGKEQADMVKVQLAPLRKWAEDTSRKWHYEGNKESKEKPLLDRELSRALSAKTRPN
ncbi:hypothetical protein CFC21_096977 [Triticum aestivum]|uniref:Uncharacterized protein n=4 Tax=Triticum TaxID=4564 RepID=A0A9R1BL06_TRITD|nr:uncharacterized protein LOC119327572 isoform X1 [Triticum dicoccoides]XP_044426329.1 uncharacterized protein LOC123150555 isoform X1 [Triticum aestivum]XP_048545250.1 uncharacterized protein LOC125524225 isoform X1 [Triticum urartu]KAF7094685.1 hypothetical protein CFC21_096977 [Triticum aestivum]VAI72557.1 unnamed protein product [Triticum turgidum subsp. durum]